MSAKEINIGTPINLNTLIDTRLLIQANSGGGKSWTIRKLCEEAAGKVQIIILDLEGEFVTLRKVLDCVYFGNEGDAAVDIRYADKIATTILELNISAIIDLYELKSHERILFVKRFLNSMINAPKELWHQCLVIVDEAHVFCPEKGKAESMGSVIDLCTRGRKRGFCAVLATQRLSKLAKDAAAECNNKLIGRTSLDVDLKRAAEELGFTSKQQMLSMRDLSPGEFYAFGPAISTQVNKIKITSVITEHPKSGRRVVTVPPASTAIKNILSKLKDIPKEAEKEVKNVQDYKLQVANLKRELTEAKKSTASQIDPQKYQTVLDDNRKLKSELAVRDNLIEKTSRALKPLFNFKPGLAPIANNYNLLPEKKPLQTPKPVKIIPQQSNDNGLLGKCPSMILKFLALRPDSSFSKEQVGAITGYSPKSGGFNNSISQLAIKNLIIREGGKLRLNKVNIDEAIDLLGSDYSTPEQYSKEDWLQKLGVCPQKIYRVLLDNPETDYSKEELGDITGYSAGSGGFNNSISKLCTLGLVERVNGRIRLNRELLEV